MKQKSTIALTILLFATILWLYMEYAITGVPIPEPVAAPQKQHVELIATSAPERTLPAATQKPVTQKTKPILPSQSTSTATTSTPAKAIAPLPTTFNTQTLAQYDGSDPSLPILIAFEGNVYDVTPGRSFYEPGAGYHFLAGTDGTKLLQVIGGDIIKRKYKVVGAFTQ